MYFMLIGAVYLWKLSSVHKAPFKYKFFLELQQKLNVKSDQHHDSPQLKEGELAVWEMGHNPKVSAHLWRMYRKYYKILIAVLTEFRLFLFNLFG